MRTAFAAAISLLAATSTGLAQEQNEFKTAGAFIDRYQANHDLLLRLFIRGIGDGFSTYNAMQDHSDGGGRKLYCPPEKVGIVDAQYVAIMSDFLKKYPKTRSQPVGAVLLFALVDTFPCGMQ